MSDTDPSGNTMRIDITPTTSVRSSRTRRKSAGQDTFAPRRMDRGGERNLLFHKLLESVYDAVLITDQRGGILDFNGRAEQFFLMDAAHLTGMPVFELISGADESLIDTLHSNLKEHTFTIVEALCTRSNGSMFPVEIAVNRVNLDAEGQLCFFVRDISVRKKQQQELEAAVERLEALDRGRLEFVSNVSHELRTPLTSMIYAVKNMLRGVAGPLSTKGVQYLERLDADCRRLLATVNDILDLRQIENRSLTLSKSRAPLTRLAESGVEALRVQADEKRVQVTLTVSRQHCFVLVDPHKMERVVLNLVGNAIKFTPSGGWIRVSVEPADAQMAELRVSDNGIGIPASALDKVTMRYYKVGDQPTGSGLGLAISKEVVELHGGTLIVQSPVPGTTAGTQVCVRLPMVPGPAVVVASEDERLRTALGEQCLGQGYQVALFGDGHHAVAHCRSQQTDALVLDMQVGSIAATDVLMHLKNDQKTSRLPVIMLAGGTLTRPQLELLQGFNVPVLAKPVREQDVLGRLASLFLTRTPVPRGADEPATVIARPRG